MTVIDVPPYLEFVVFDLEGAEPSGVRVFPPMGPRPRGLAELSDSEVRWSPRLTTVLVRRPVPGLWRFSGSAPEVRVRIRELKSFVRGRVLEPPARVSHGAGRCRLVYEVLDDTGGPLSLHDEGAVDVNVAVLRPDGSREAVTLEVDPDHGSVFACTKGIACDLPGRYWIEVVVATRGAEERPVVLLRDSSAGFAVADESPD